ncbi:hypothetical protein A4A49_00631 [Nicotiana attenuata]|uniref:Uncharacterized protein n=1 Tax=Nicotiana attenuata TaxID=49451 RepID=A0A1J6HUY4_NICAT|nr:hypothetical protein A4A49_00631 [Nicotiana attenuata]
MTNQFRCGGEPSQPNSVLICQKLTLEARKDRCGEEESNRTITLLTVEILTGLGFRAELKLGATLVQ